MPLEKEIVNTLKENFLWNEGTDTLLVLKAGLYRVRFGLFSDNKNVTPYGSLIINGEIRFTSTEQNFKKKKTSQIGKKVPYTDSLNHEGIFTFNFSTNLL